MFVFMTSLWFWKSNSVVRSCFQSLLGRDCPLLVTHSGHVFLFFFSDNWKLLGNVSYCVSQGAPPSSLLQIILNSA